MRGFFLAVALVLLCAAPVSADNCKGGTCQRPAACAQKGHETCRRVRRIRPIRRIVRHLLHPRRCCR